MATVTRTTTWNSGDTLTASALNGEFNNLLNALALVDADISGSANIAASKLASTVVTTTGTQTLTNKTLTKPTVNGSTQAYTSDTDGATVTFDMTSSNVHTVTLAGNRTLAVSNVSTGQWFTVILRQDGTGSRTVTWWGSIVWSGGSAPTLTTTANQWDIFVFVYDGTRYFGSIAGQGYA